MSQIIIKFNILQIIIEINKYWLQIIINKNSNLIFKEMKLNIMKFWKTKDLNK